MTLQPGVCLLIRIKNESATIRECILSTLNFVDEIVVVDNNSNDTSFEIVTELSQQHPKIKLYKYPHSVPKVGYNTTKPSLADYCNYGLEQVSHYNVIKWDGDCIALSNNLECLIKTYNLNTRGDKFCIWFSCI